MKIYDLIPADGKKSFYGKAKVFIGDDGTETLYSYDTPIIKRTAAGELVRMWDGWSATTGATHHRILWNAQSRIHKTTRDGSI